MEIIDYLLMIAFVVGAAAVLERMVRWLRGWPAEGAYIPDSDAPKCGWPKAIIGTIAVIALAGFVLWAGVIVGL